MTNCEDCKTAVSESARVCPHCARQLGPARRVTFWRFAAWIILLAALADAAGELTRIADHMR